jgi:hypothetical protein
MPATPDRDTLRLRRPDRRPPAEAVALAARELARRPRAYTATDVRLSPPDRALVSFGERYPGVAERFHPGVLWSAAHGHAHPGQPARHPCGWDLARAWQRRHRGPALRVDPLGRRLLGDPCGSCQAALGWRPPAPPRPKPKPRTARSRSGTNRTAAARSSTARSSTARSSTARTSGSRSIRVPLPGRALAAAAGCPADGLSPKRAAENAAALRRMKMNPADWPHLTRPGRR